MTSNPPNNLLNKNFIIRFVLILAVLICVNVVFNMTHSFLMHPYSKSLKLTNWKYSYGTSLNFPDLKDDCWHETNEQNPIKISGEKGSYLFMHTTLSDKYSGEVLYIRSFYGQISVKLDSQTLSTQPDEEKFSGTPTIKIQLPEFDDAQILRITAYFPFSRNIEIYASSPTANYQSLLFVSSLPYVYNTFLIALGILWIFAMLIFPQLKQTGLNSFISSLVLIFFGTLEILDLYFINNAISASPVLFKVRLASYVLFSWLTLMFFANKNTKWNSILEVLTALNVLYSLCVGALHYEVFYVLTVKAGIILQAVNVGFMLHHLLFVNNKHSAFKCAFVAEIILVQFFFWLSLITPSLKCDFGLITTANIFYALYMMFSNIIYAPTLSKSKNEKISKEVNGSKAYQREKGGLLIIPESSLPPIEIKLANKKDETKNGLVFESFESRFEMNKELIELILEKCDTENHHMLHVAEFANVLCRQMRLNSQLTYDITSAALLHDIGKLKVSAEVLFKTEKLTDDEFKAIRKHHLFGCELLKKAQDPIINNYAAQIALEHHEHIDGTGYLKLKGNEIELGARIVAVADVFDALVSPRCYKKTWSFEQGFDYIVQNSGSFFDADVVNAFVESKKEIKRIYDIYAKQFNDNYIET